MKTTNYNTTQVVEEIGKISIQGNTIPPSWFNHIVFENGKPDLVSIIILSDIIYWYRPRVKRDEVSGSVIGKQKRFQADKLQRSYEQLSNQFGITKRQAQDSIRRLKELKLIQTELRIINKGGIKIGNVLFLEPIPERINEISNVNPSTFKRERGIHSNVEGYTSERDTYTETTTETTTEDNNNTFEGGGYTYGDDDESIECVGYIQKPKKAKQQNKKNLVSSPEAKEVLDYLNSKTNTSFSYSPELNARLEEGYAVGQCKRIIDHKVSQWLRDAKMRRYLRPPTLFGSEKILVYLGELPKDDGTGTMENKLPSYLCEAMGDD